MVKITEEPEFVFYHNPIKGVCAYHLGGNVNIEELVEASFRQLSPDEIVALQQSDIVYVSRQIYGDERVWNPCEIFGIGSPNFDILQGLMRVQISGKPNNLIIEYTTAGNCSGRIRTDITRGVYDSPDLDKINDLITRFGEGIFAAPTMEEGLRVKQRMEQR